MKLANTFVHDAYAEAFRMRYARLIITAIDQFWLDAAVREATGYAASVIACDVEAGLDRYLPPQDTPDGRPGAVVLFFGFSAESLARSVPTRVGQCVMTCPTTAVYNGLPVSEERIPLGNHLRYFGDGHQRSKLIGDRRYWRIPVMDGEFLVEAIAGVGKGVGGGSLIVQAATQMAALAASRRAASAIDLLDGVIAPFPGGVVRSGSKVGSRYRGLRASTNEAWCPILRGRYPSELDPDANCAYELVFDGIDEQIIGRAMADAARAAAGPETLSVSAANFGGNLGKFKFDLRQMLDRYPAVARATPTTT
jgi:formylmethanofuran--tetrahydromethanopterin N-formyltransferase